MARQLVYPKAFWNQLGFQDKPPATGVIGLPVINGGTSQHMHNPYFPIPYSPGMLDSIADGS